MAFPTTLDTFTATTCNDPRTISEVVNDIQDATEALEVKVGVDNSAVVTTIDYLLKSPSSSNPGHKHTLAQGATDVTATASEVNRLAGVTPGTVAASKAVVADANLSVNSLGIYAPQGFMVNGQLSVSVSSSNLTIALKTSSGGDPSATDPVHIRIGNTLRHVTSALSITLSAGTNWFNSGSSELATKEIDYFVFLIYNTNTSSVSMVVSRLPFPVRYSSFSATSTAEKYGAPSTGAAPASTDVCQNVGRFNATLSAGAGYTWSIPATSLVLNSPQWESRWLDWQPTYSAASSMTFTSVTTAKAQYKLTGDDVIVRFNVSGTLGGVASAEVRLTTPWNGYDDPSTFIGTGYNSDSGYVGGIQPNTSSQLLLTRVSGGNYSLAAGKQFTGSIRWKLST